MGTLDRHRALVVSRLAVCAALAVTLHFAAGGELIPLAAKTVKSVLRRPETAAILLGAQSPAPTRTPAAQEPSAPCETSKPETTPVLTAPAETAESSVTPQLLYFAAPASPEVALSYESVPAVDNNTDYDIDPAALMEGGLAEYTGTVLIVHTHTSESYSTGTESTQDSFRTDDNTRNVVRVGSELESVLTARGIAVIHDTTVHDVPYTGAYTRALETIEEEVAAHPEISVVIDIHRDAFSDGAGGVGRTSCTVNGASCAQVMLVMGSDACGLEHPDWKTNLTLGLFLQSRMDDVYPGLTRKLFVSENRYNQHMTKGSMILEVGCTGNTVEEAVLAVRCFGECCADVLLG